MRFLLLIISIISLYLLNFTFIHCKSVVESVEHQIAKRSNWCCAIDPPPKPVFSEWGDIIHFEQQKCPNQYLVCCKGHLNLNGNCLDFEEIKKTLPNWQELAKALNITTLEVMQQLG